MRGEADAPVNTCGEQGALCYLAAVPTSAAHKRPRSHRAQSRSLVLQGREPVCWCNSSQWATCEGGAGAATGLDS